MVYVYSSQTTDAEWNINLNCIAQNKLDKESGKKESCTGKIQELEKALKTFDKSVSGNIDDPRLDNSLGTQLIIIEINIINYFCSNLYQTRSKM